MNFKYVTALVLIAILPLGLFAQTAGIVEFSSGTVSFARNGKVTKTLKIGEKILFNDTLTTGSNGQITLALDKASGFSGKITMKSKTSFTIKLESLNKTSTTQLNMAAGSVGLKLTKLSGSSQLQVKTESAVMGVRGTTFEVVTSPQGNVLVSCTEGKVECTLGESTSEDDFFAEESEAQESAFAVPGVAIATVADGDEYTEDTARKFKKIDFDIKLSDKLVERWNTEEITVFRTNAPRAMAYFAKRYASGLKDFNSLYDILKKDAVVAKWIKDAEKGIKPNLQAAMSEKKAVDPYFFKLQKIMFFFEIDYLRLVQIQSYITGTANENADIGQSLKAGAFIKKMAEDGDALAEKLAFLKYAVKLYQDHSLMNL